MITNNVESKLMFGWCEKSITPNEKVCLAGQFFSRVTDQVETPINVTTLVIDNGLDQVVFCSCDMVSVSSSLIDVVRQKLKNLAPDLNGDKIIIHATHTHSSLLYDKKLFCKNSNNKILQKVLPKNSRYVNNVDMSEGASLDKIEEFLTDNIALCIATAWDNRSEGYYSTGFGRAPVGYCRRIVCKDGNSYLYGKTNDANFVSFEGSTDSGLEMLFIYDKNKKLSGVAVTVACPAQVLEISNYISSDFWGKVKILLREKFGEDLKVLAICAPAGDISPRDLIRGRKCDKEFGPIKNDAEDYSIEKTWKIGKRISREIIDAYEEVGNNLSNAASIMHSTDCLSLPIRKVSKEDYEFAINSVNNYFEKENKEIYDFYDLSKLDKHLGIIDRWEIQSRISFIDIELHTVRIGKIAFATFPFEIFIAYGDRIKALSRAEQTFLIQLANGAYSYLPTSLAEKGGSYSANVANGVVGSESGEMIVDFYVNKISELFDKKSLQ